MDIENGLWLRKKKNIIYKDNIRKPNSELINQSLKSKPTEIITAPLSAACLSFF